MAELVLEVVEGPGAGRQVPVARMAEIGRGEDSAIRLDDQQASRHHARIWPVEGGAAVDDLGSTNGTFVNGNRIHGPTLLGPNDQLRVGVTVFQVRTADDMRRQPTLVRPVPAGLAGAAPARPAAPTAPGPPVAVGPAGPRQAEPSIPELDALLDARTKAKARAAPLAVFILVVFAVLIYLAATR
jgi:predicted component of type VI protein secretion system